MDDGLRKRVPPGLSARIRDRVETPAIVVDERIVGDSLERTAALRAATGCRLLYSLKALADAFLLERMQPWVDGFSASSLFEARLARAAAHDGGTVHLTTPGLRAFELEEISHLCDSVAFNSLSQLERLGAKLGSPCRAGLRINPSLSLVSDARYDPCRPHSKLGVPLEALRRTIDHNPALLDAVSGVHFHTNRLANDFGGLLDTVRRLENHLGDWLPRLEWINLGGGYLFDEPVDARPFVEAVECLRSGFGLAVFIEPGSALVRRAGFLVSEVVDLFPSSGKTIAVLDTTVNHWPEVFEYQLRPAVAGERAGGRHSYVLAGSSCLAGDLFGEHAFDEPLSVGSRVVFPDVGAYALAKAHAFNGINLPCVYSIAPDGTLILRRRFTFEEFASRTAIVGRA